ncbi:NAD(P)-binding protein [Dichomitus squalens]|uniref:NAD(P)-binding protein n=1 Tax=Dichomitus squalens TaxID=114155 RepID=A0A4Q9M4F5_9APHY|nr:NAD(P)-binding protein [Dichomitus squalens]
MPLPTKMTAVVISKTGNSPDVIEEFQFPVPTPGPNQILIKVEWAGVNWSDAQKRRGVWPLPLPPFPFALGVECAGTIVSVPTDDEVLKDEEYKVRSLKIGGRVVSFGMAFPNGPMSEYFVTTWDTVYPLPDEISGRTAIATLIPGCTALALATEAYNVQAGDFVLVHTVAGSVGLFFAQLIKSRGGIVIGTTSTPEKAAIAKANGADHVIIYKTENVAQRVLEITGGLGVHAIFDGVGKDTFQTDLACIRTKGTIVWLGFASGLVEPFAPHITAMKAAKYVFASAAAYFADRKAGREYVAEVFRLVTNGVFKPVVHKEYPLSAEGVREAERELWEGKTAGKCLVKVAAE